MEKVSLDALIPSLDDLNFPEPEDTQDLDPITEEEFTNEDITNTDDIPEPSPQNNELATLYYRELMEQGVVAETDKDSFSWEDVHGAIDAYKTELPNQIVQNIVDSAPEVGRSLIDYVLTKGQNLSKEDLREFYTTYLNDISAPDSISDEDSAREFLNKAYIEKGFTKLQAESAVDALEDEGVDIVQKAKETANQHKSKEVLDNAKQQTADQKQRDQEFVTQLNEELQSLNWRSSRVNKLRTELVSGSTNETLTKIVSNPKGLVQLANLLTYYDADKQVFNLEDFVKQVETKEKRGLKNSIRRDMFNSVGNNDSKTLETKLTRGELKPII